MHISLKESNWPNKPQGGWSSPEGAVAMAKVAELDIKSCLRRGNRDPNADLS